MMIRWFLSAKVRHATEMCKHVQKLLRAQEDILPPATVQEVAAALDQARSAIDSHADDATLAARIKELEQVATAKLRKYPNPELRENVEVLLVAIAVAMAIRTFFLQPFKIPTSSMQPTLYGVTADPLEGKVPGFGKRMSDSIVRGTFHHYLEAPEDCELLEVRFRPVMRFINKHEFVVRLSSGQIKVIPYWFSSDERLELTFAGLRAANRMADGRGQTFKKGEPILNFKEITGDHLFVDRVTYNFRRPERGEIIVFKTRGITGIPNQEQFYIKRLVGLPGEKIQIGDDRHVRIDGRRLDATDPRFENLYSFSPDQPIKDSHYRGHGQTGYLSTDSAVFELGPRAYFALGDNTSVSADSRFWGEVPRENVIGKAFFVYWPISNRDGSRFGLGYR